MKTIPELRETVRAREQRRLTLGRDIGTKRVEVKHVEQLRHEVATHGFNLVVDEPEERGGTHSGPDPLAYFVTGAASCFLNQFARTIIIRDLKIDSLEMTARAHYDMAKNREFLDFIYDVRLIGSETRENVSELMHEAERRCFVHQTLKKALPLTTNVYLNGERVVSHTLGPNQRA